LHKHKKNEPAYMFRQYKDLGREIMNMDLKISVLDSNNAYVK
jgi:hypothetical protein